MTQRNVLNGVAIACSFAAALRCSSPEQHNEPLATVRDDIINGTAVLGTNVVYPLVNGCSATAINRDWILTARHCVAPYPGETFAMTDVGTNKARDVLIHPTLDVALLRMSTPNGVVSETAMYSGSTANLMGQTLDCYGWGLNAYDGGTSGVLRHAFIPVTSPTSNPYYTLSQNSSGQIQWLGDSGGPCFLNGQQTGVQSIADPSAHTATQPSAEAFRGWVYSAIQANLSPFSAFVAGDIWPDFSRASGVLAAATYSTAILMNMADNDISAVRTGGMTSMTLFDGSGLTGASIALAGDHLDLRSDGWNDRASSGQVMNVAGTNCPDPSPTQVVVWSDNNYSGSCDVLFAGSYDDVSILNVGDEHISSIKLGSQVRATLYHDKGYQGSKLSITTNQASLPTFNDTTSSIRINGTSCPAPTATQVVLWSDNYFLGSCKVLNIGNYPDIGAAGFGNDSASSIQVGTSVAAHMYDNWTYGGTLQYAYSDLDILNAVGFNDLLSSVKVGAYRNCGTPGPNQVVVWDDINRSGHCDVVEIGTWPIPITGALDGSPFAGDFEVTNDSLSSIQTGTNVTITLYRDYQLANSCVTIPKNTIVNDLTSFNGSNCNDVASSAIVSN